MELQLFHYNSKYLDYETASLNSDGLAAVSVFYQISATNNTAIDSLFSATSTLTEEVRNMGVEFEVPLPGVEVHLGALLPPGGLQLWDNYYYYSGSQTLPRNQTAFDDAKDCTEPVLWIVYEKTIPISEAQMTAYRRLLVAANYDYRDHYEVDYSGDYSGNYSGDYGGDYGIDPPCVHNFRPVHDLYANDTGSYFCAGDFLCSLAQIFGEITNGGSGTVDSSLPAITGRQFGGLFHFISFG